MFEALSIPAELSSESVSIIIPVFNNAILTYQCLKSIIEHTSPGSYEIVVVDNASTDATSEMLSRVNGGIKVLRNQTNLGFGEACNQGARAASGDSLLFLNNDITVEPDWLTPLVETMAADPKIGAVGSKLVFTDGRLQEAGGIIWSDGSGWNYGRGDDPDRPEYNYVREVDYCSAACLLVRRGPFEELGGFNRLYAPAYYEDTHLCFELRRLGYRVIYQPASRVTHLEGGTAGTDPTLGYKRYLTMHRETFREQQELALRSQHEAQSKNVFRARDRGTGLRILVIDDKVPELDRDSGSLRRTTLLSLMTEEGHRLTFLPDNLERKTPYTERLQQMGIEVLYGPLDIPDYLKACGPEFDLIIVSRAPVAIKYLPFLRTELPNAKLIFDTVDLHYLRAFRQATLEQTSEGMRRSYILKHTELYLGRLSSSMWVVSPTERDLLLMEDPGLPVSIIPNIHDVRSHVPRFEDRRDVMFIGGFQHPPNEDAAVYFAEEILPLLWEELPDLRFYIVGSSPTPSVLRLKCERIVVTGYVKDTAPYFDRSRVFVAPLRYGAGIKGKIGQSLGNGLPVVSSFVGAEGMGLTDGENVFLAEEPVEFAAAVLRLYRDRALWEKFSEGGRELIDRNYSTARIRPRLVAEIEAVRRREYAESASGSVSPAR